MTTEFSFESHKRKAEVYRLWNKNKIRNLVLNQRRNKIKNRIRIRVENKNCFKGMVNLLALLVGLVLFVPDANLWAASIKAPEASTLGTQNAPILGRADDLSCTLEMRLNGAVSPGTLDFVERGFEKAEQQKCDSILVLIDTPGGNLQTTRLIVERILASPIPVLCLVSPSGAHAGSAGAIILFACHVNGMELATNVGAALPVVLGRQPPDDSKNEGSGGINRQVPDKIVSDTVSWVQGLARLRGRNVDLAEKVVSEARAFDAEQAVRNQLVDTLAVDVGRFLEFAEGREVTMAAGRQTKVRVGALIQFQPDLRAEFLRFVMDPEIAYLIFLASLALLFFEITHPGTVVPGVTGGIGLIVALMAFHKLNVTWGALALVVFGVIMLIAEVFIPSFGALGVGGLVAMATGSFLLFDPAVTGDRLSLGLIFAVSLTLAAAMLTLGVLALRTLRLGRARSEMTLIGSEGVVARLESPSLRRGMVSVAGEYWSFVCDRDLDIGDRVVVMSQEGMVLKVKAQDQTTV